MLRRRFSRCQPAPDVTCFQAVRSASTSFDSGSSRSCGTVMMTRLAARPCCSQTVTASRSSAARRWWIWRADWAQPDVAAGFQAAVVGVAVLDPDLDLIADRDGAAVTLPLGCVRIGGCDGPQVHPRAAAPSGWIVAGQQGWFETLRLYRDSPVAGAAGTGQWDREMIGGLLRFAPGRLGAR